jgi:hypothetical protein
MLLAKFDSEELNNVRRSARGISVQRWAKKITRA